MLRLLQMCSKKRQTQVFIVFHINIKSDFADGHVIVGVRSTLHVQGISLLCGINVAGGKAMMDPIVSEEVSNEENELDNRVVFSYMCCNLSHENAFGRRGDFITRWYYRNK